MFTTYNSKNFDQVTASEAASGLKHYLDKTNERAEFELEAFLSTFKETVLQFLDQRDTLEQLLGPLMASLEVFGTDKEFRCNLFRKMCDSLGDASTDLARVLFRVFDIDQNGCVSIEEIVETILLLHSPENKGTFLEFTEPIVPALFRLFSTKNEVGMILMEEINSITQSFLKAFNGLVKLFFITLEEFLKGDSFDTIHAKVCLTLWSMVSTDEDDRSNASEIHQDDFLRFLLRNFNDLPADVLDSMVVQLKQEFSIPKLDAYIHDMKKDFESIMSTKYEDILSKFNLHKKDGRVLRSTCIEFTSASVVEIVDEICNCCIGNASYQELQECFNKQLTRNLEEINSQISKFLSDKGANFKVEFDANMIHGAISEIFVQTRDTIKLDSAPKLTEAVLTFLDVNDDKLMDLQEFNDLANSIKICYEHGLKPGQAKNFECLLRSCLCLVDVDGNKMISRDEIKHILQKIRDVVFKVISVIFKLCYKFLQKLIESFISIIFQIKKQILQGSESELSQDEMNAFLLKMVPLAENWTSLMTAAARNKKLDVLEDAVNAVNHCGQSALHIAAMCGHINIIKHLLAAKARVDIEDAKGRTPLDILDAFKSKKGRNPVDDAECAEILKSNGSSGWTELMIAAEQGKKSEVVALKKKRQSEEHLANDQFCDVDVQNKFGFTALHFAVQSGDVEICQVLIKAGANPMAKSITGITPIDLAISTRNFSSVPGFRHDNRLRFSRKSLKPTRNIMISNLKIF